MSQSTESLEIVKPTIVNDIEFYVSIDGKQSGVSQRGLARLVGVSQEYMRGLLAEIERLGSATADFSDNEITSVSAPIKKAALAIHEGLSLTLYLPLTSSNSAKVVQSKTAARIIRYYAYHADRKLETAVFSYDKFAEIGIDTWIKKVTKYTESSNTEALLLTMSQTLNVLVADIAQMKAELFNTEGYRSARVELKGLKIWMETIEAEEFKQLQLPSTTEEELFTLNEWAYLAHDEMVLPRSKKHALANIISSTYKLMALEAPKKVVRLNAKGVKLPPVQAYPRRHFVLINMCFTKLVSGS